MQTPTAGSEVVFFIDKEQFKTTSQTLTVRSILVDFAKEDPAQSVLSRHHGNRTEKFTDLDQVLPIENGMKFFVLHTTPTTVS